MADTARVVKSMCDMIVDEARKGNWSVAHTYCKRLILDLKYAYQAEKMKLPEMPLLPEEKK